VTIDLVALRRELHSYPEPAFLEIRTAARIAVELAALGADPIVGAEAIRLDAVADYPAADALDAAAEQAVQTGADSQWVRRIRDGGTAVVTDIAGRRPGPRWALRFDIDGLAIAEAAQDAHLPHRLGFASHWPGRMHACGHDGHAAIGIGLAARLLANRDFPGSVRLLFQPAEEGGRGAAAMLDAGVVDGVDRFAAIHLGLDLPSREVIGGVVGGFATDKLHVRIQGASAHASLAPQRGCNALAAAAMASLGILGQPRWSTAPTRVNVGRLSAGDAVNVIPGWADMLVEVRSTDEVTQGELTDAVGRMVDGSAAAYGCTAQVERTGGSTVLRSDDGLAEAVVAQARALGADAVTHGPFHASDDASLLMRAVQAQGGTATYAAVGADNPAPHHSSLFDIDESALPFAVDLLDRLIAAGVHR
jgi:aminobenzoyl-glutamate utilization protein A